jgi:hypothetical protein
MQPLSDCFKLLPRYLSTQTQQFRALAMPFTLHTTGFIVIVAVFQMPLSIGPSMQASIQNTARCALGSNVALASGLAYSI